MGETPRRLAWLVPSGATAAARTPFVVLVVALLGAGLIALLLLNAAVNQGSFELGELRRDTTVLTDEEQRLQREIDAYAAPDALSRRAGELGMVPGGAPAFLSLDGRVRGSASPAPVPPRPAPSPTPTPTPKASASAGAARAGEGASQSPTAGPTADPAPSGASQSAPSPAAPAQER
ncbi:septum formation initiator [Streptomyces polyrhachis]|uniref:Septum formation initiator n=1 Tax=Streptomyces polyrhachis TaxID=1282885 RepID=A0ABW2GAY3_9ACTN